MLWALRKKGWPYSDSHPRVSDYHNPHILSPNGLLFTRLFIQIFFITASDYILQTFRACQSLTPAVREESAKGAGGIYAGVSSLSGSLATNSSW